MDPRSGTFYLFDNRNLGIAGTYQQELQTTSGCDSIVTLQLFVLPSTSYFEERIICDGESIQIGTFSYSEAGDYWHTLEALNGCDSTYCNNVLIADPVAAFISDTTFLPCPPDSVFFTDEDGEVIEKEEVNYVPGVDEYRHYLTVKKPLHNEHGEIIGLFGISTDVTEQKVADRRLRDSETKLSTILDNVGAYVYIKDSDRRFRYINKKTEELFGLSSEKILGMNNYELLGEVQGEEFDRTDRQVFEAGTRMACIETFNAGDETYNIVTIMVELSGFEPLTLCLQSRCSTN